MEWMLYRPNARNALLKNAAMQLAVFSFFRKYHLMENHYVRDILIQFLCYVKQYPFRLVCDIQLDIKRRSCYNYFVKIIPTFGVFLKIRDKDNFALTLRMKEKG